MSESSRKILDATARLVAEYGVRAVSIRDVARRAGVSHQAPYHHFGDQRGLLRELAREGFVKLASLMQAASQASQAHGGSALDALVATGRAYVGFGLSHRGHVRLMFESSAAVSREDEQPMVEAERGYQILVEHARAAHEAGFGRGLGVDRMAVLCWSTVHGLTTLMTEGALLPKGTREEDAAERLIDQVLSDLSLLLAP